MKVVKFVAVVALLVSVISCSTPDEKMKKYMIGNWKTIYYKWELPTFKGKDTLVEYAFDYTNPEEHRPEGVTIYKYKEDGVFETWNEKSGSVVGVKTKGKWRATKDSLYYDFEHSKGSSTIVLKLSVIEDGYATNRVVDQDRDGEVDDILYIETVRLPDTPKEK
ncbi:hypothetical protein [Flavicella sediminum]|uniref:hypothetical protein n=1 Tax=Flavicella sediminum TaxID=2585141 RepID=UPI001124C99C|nr:hypothetical protein [Flavicella sediminum]